MISLRRSKILFVIILTFIFTIQTSAYVYAAGAPTISKKSFDLIVGKTYDLNIKNASKGAKYQWSSGDNKIATVDKNGLVKGIASGTTKITCKVTSSGKTYTLSSTVNVIKGAKSVTILKSTEWLKVGETLDLDHKLSPGSSNDKITWTSSDTSIAKPNSKGKFKALKGGEVTITATSVSGAKASVTIKVYDEEQLTISSELLKNNKLTLSDKAYKNIYISSSVKKSDIKLENVHVLDTLTLEVGAKYNIKANASSINRLEYILPEGTSKAADGLEAPSLSLGKKSLIKDVTMKANGKLEAAGSAKINNITLSPVIDGNYDIHLVGYSGNLTIDYKAKAATTIELESCKIGTADIINAAGDHIALSSHEKKPSTIKTVKLKSKIPTTIDIETKELIINKKLKSVNLIVASAINKLTHYGSDIIFIVTEDGYIKELVDKQNSDKAYGKYTFSNTRSEIAFSATIRGMKIEGIRLKDFEKFFQLWPDQTKPLVIPEGGITVTRLEKDYYKLNFAGMEITLGIIFDQGIVIVNGSKDIIISDICVAQNK